jgi:hypothetical protein
MKNFLSPLDCFLKLIILLLVSSVAMLLFSCENHDRKNKAVLENEAVWISRFWANNQNLEFKELIRKIETEKSIVIDSGRWIEAGRPKAASPRDVVFYSNVVVRGELLAIHADLSISWHEVEKLREILTGSAQ